MRQPTYAEVGASIYVPATHGRLDQLLSEGCHGARSMIVCTEDAVAEDAVAWAVRRLLKALKHAPAEAACLRFLRPRNPFVLTQVLSVPAAVTKLDGVVLPKFDATTAGDWKEALALAPQLPVMPTLETPALFTESGAMATRQALETLTNPVVALRIGANDLLGSLGLKRQPGQTLYDTPLRGTLERIVTLFRSAGYELCAPVCDLIGEPETLAREVAQDMAWGFYAKTCVHPSQIEVIEAHYKHSLIAQQRQAEALLSRNDAVFKQDGQMLEQTCHGEWARRIQTLQASQ